MGTLCVQKKSFQWQNAKQEINANTLPKQQKKQQRDRPKKSFKSVHHVSILLHQIQHLTRNLALTNLFFFCGIGGGRSSCGLATALADLVGTWLLEAAGALLSALLEHVIAPNKFAKIIVRINVAKKKKQHTADMHICRDNSRGSILLGLAGPGICVNMISQLFDCCQDDLFMSHDYAQSVQVVLPIIMPDTAKKLRKCKWRSGYLRLKLKTEKKI